MLQLSLKGVSIMENIVCPFISSGNSIVRCHPMCKCLDQDGSCKIISFMDNVDKIANNNSDSKS